jgi:xylulokinase
MLAGYGTTAIKLLCLANDGTIVYSDSLPHDLLTSNEGFAEEDTSVWEQHTYALFTSLIAHSLR